MDVRVGLWRRLSTEELILLNCGVGEDSWESLGLQGDPTSPFWRRSAWDFFGGNDARVETPVLWPPHVKSWLIGKDSDAGRGWGQEEKGMTEDEMAGWHHWLDGHESGWTPGVGDGRGGLACCDSWGHKKLDTTERLNWTELNWTDVSLWFWLPDDWQLMMLNIFLHANWSFVYHLWRKVFSDLLLIFLIETSLTFSLPSQPAPPNEGLLPTGIQQDYWWQETIKSWHPGRWRGRWTGRLRLPELNRLAKRAR